MLAKFNDRYTESYNYATNHTIPWMAANGFTILSDEEKKKGSKLDMDFGADYTALKDGKKVGLAVKNWRYDPVTEPRYVFVFREKCLMTNKMREYFKLKCFADNWEKSVLYKEYGIQDMITVQTFYDKVDGVYSPRCFAYTSFKNVLALIEEGVHERFKVGYDKPAEFIKVTWKDMRKRDMDITMEIILPHKVKYTRETGFSNSF